MTTQRLAVLASGEGSTLSYLIDACDRRQLDAQVEVVIANNSSCGALKRAASARIPYQHLSLQSERSAPALDQRMLQSLIDYQIHWVLLLGYLKPLGSRVLAHFPDRVINTHPSLLPQYGGQGMYGRHVHQAVIDDQCQQTGVTVHYVNQDYDQGKIIAQKTIDVDVAETVDSLMQKVKTIEQPFLIQTLRDLFSTTA